jgi:hypothetical protein
LDRLVLVFQYGSNCLDSEINGPDRLRGDARFVGIAATVEDFQIAFDVFSQRRQCAAADIVRTPGSKVWGALYEVPDHLIGRQTTPAGRRSMDAIEGEGTNYRRECIRVRMPNDNEVKALTYTVRNPRQGLRTNAAYAGLIISGLRQRGVDLAYIDSVRTIAAANMGVSVGTLPF